MRHPAYHLLSLLLALAVGTALASGQRSMTVTPADIETYPVIDLDASALPEPALHYVGSTPHWHLLMITKTSVPKDSQGRLGMPWDAVFAYKISAADVTIDNGWVLPEQRLQTGITVHPRDCPRLSLQPGRKHYTLVPGQPDSGSCIED